MLSLSNYLERMMVREKGRIEHNPINTAKKKKTNIQTHTGKKGRKLDAFPLDDLHLT